MSSDSKRVVLFIDYQNVYRGARRAFCVDEWEPHVEGQVHPLRLGLMVKGLRRTDRALKEVRIYRGMPSPKFDRHSYDAAQRQIDLWNNQACVRVFPRPLNYRDPSAPREKGVDVLLAVDFVMMAQRREYDVGVIFSGDTDLLPALEAVANMEDGPDVEVAAWSHDDGYANRLKFPGDAPAKGPWCNFLSRSDYEHVRDPTDYGKKRRRR